MVIDSQWFASAEEEGRTEEPSEYKLRKAREEGRVAKSQEINGSLVMLLTVGCLLIIGGWLFNNIVAVIRFYFDRCATMEITDPAVFGVFLEYLVRCFLPIAIVAIVAAVAGNIIQTKGFIFSVKPITPNFSKILPKFGEYFKRTIFSGQGLFNIFKSLFKVAVIFFSAYLIIKNELPKLLALENVSLWTGVVYLSKLVAKLLLIASVIFLGVSIPDYFVQRHEFMEQMKMSKQEVKEEYKELEGDPYTKSRLRQYMREMMSQNVYENVAKADVVITNPTHYAVAVLYDRDTMQGPTVMAKGVDSLALRIKEIARENNVEIVENKPLARALYAQVEIGDIIPREFWEALSIILQRIYRMKGKM